MRRPYQLPADMFGALLVAGEVGVEIVGEKENFQDREHDDQLDDDDGPQGAAQGHAPESVDIKEKDAAEQAQIDAILGEKKNAFDDLIKQAQE